MGSDKISSSINQQEIFEFFKQAKGNEELAILQAFNTQIQIDGSSIEIQEGKKISPLVLQYDQNNAYYSSKDKKIVISKDAKGGYFIKKITTNDGISITQERTLNRTTDEIDKKFTMINEYKSNEDDSEYIKKYKGKTKQIIEIDKNNLTIRKGDFKYDHWATISSNGPHCFHISGNTSDNYQLILDEIKKLEISHPGITGYINTHIPMLNKAISYCYEMHQVLKSNNIIRFDPKRK